MTGNQLVNREHKELLEAVNRLMDACSEGKGREKSAEVFRYLLSYVDKHFADEERLQMQAKYPGYAAHKNFHESYKKNLRDIEKTLVAEGPTIAMLQCAESAGGYFGDAYPLG
ncbi:MAG: bacteriohemerythrin [Dysosmobacter welbionis]